MIDQYKICLNGKQMNTVQIKVWGEGRGGEAQPPPSIYNCYCGTVVVMFKYVKFLKLYKMYIHFS